MPTKYILNENSQRTGPFTNQQLEQRCRAGEIDGDTPCWPVEFSGIFSGSWKPLHTYFPHFRSSSPGHQDRERQDRERQDREHQDRERQDRERRKREADQTNGVTFECVDCGTAIRLRLLKSGAVYRCPSCKTDYKMIQGNSAPPVFLVLPTSRHRTQSSDTPPKRKRPLLPEVRTAFTCFGLGDEATFDDVRRAYREHVKQYHPDKVAHLGAELRKLAEMKTKEFNSAYQILERFFTR
jgi:DnaJ-domain-containing protein 1